MNSPSLLVFGLQDWNTERAPVEPFILETSTRSVDYKGNLPTRISLVSLAETPFKYKQIGTWKKKKMYWTLDSLNN